MPQIFNPSKWTLVIYGHNIKHERSVSAYFFNIFFNIRPFSLFLLFFSHRYDKTLKEIPKIKKPKSKTNPKSDKKFSRYVRWVKNIRRFERILKPNIGAGLEDSMLRSTHGALVEGRDTVELHQSSDDAAAKGGEGN